MLMKKMKTENQNFDLFRLTKSKREVDLAPNTVRAYVADGLKTGRVMVKDEDVCLHCGLCAERCPTGAWDMQKFLVTMAHAGPVSGSAPKKLNVAMEVAPK